MITRRLILVAALAASMVVGSAAPAPAISCIGTAETAPDGKVRGAGGSWVGKGEYPLSSIAEPIPAVGGQTTFAMKWKNVDDVGHAIKVNAFSLVQTAGFSVRFFVNGVNVNDKIKVEGRIGFPGIPPGESTPKLVIVVKNKNHIGNDILVSQALGGRYKGSDPSLCDELRTRIENPV
jgi:hypothetical protein